MGLCVSTGGTAAAEPRRTTAMVLLSTEEMREYPRPATAARALEEAEEVGAGNGKKQQGWSLCDTDGMGYDAPVAAVRGDEVFRAGQIYFVLPAEARRRGMRREEVAALAVRASAAPARRKEKNSGIESSTRLRTCADPRCRAPGGVVAIVLAADKFLKQAFVAASIKFPSGMFCVFSVLAVFDTFVPALAKAFMDFFEPLNLFIQRWLPLFYVPSLVVLPLAVRDVPAASGLKILLIT